LEADMLTYLLVGFGSGLILIVLDALLNGNQYARRLAAPYLPIVREGISIAPAVAIDLLYGLAMAGFFLLLRTSFPGGPIVGSAISFALLAWFFRSVMNALSQWVMFRIPSSTHLYALFVGLVEMLVLGFFYAFAFRSF
jgi:hypothetical protein